MPEYRYDVIINAKYNASGVTSGVDAQTQKLTGFEKKQIAHYNKLEEIAKQTENKLLVIHKQSNAHLLTEETRHQNKILEINKKASSDKQILFVKETQAHEAHLRKKELLELKNANRLKEIQARGGTNYESTFKGLRNSFADVSNVITGVTTAVGSVISIFDTFIGYARTGATTLFDLAKGASDFGSNILEMSQQTGLGAETISALKLQADQTNVSMESLVTGVNRFEKTIAEAERGNKKAIDSLKRLGIDPVKAANDYEGALKQVLKVIDDAPEGIQQASAANDAFGKSGVKLLPIIKQMGGDLDETVRKAKALGLTFTEDQAKAADDFGDTLTVLQAQLKGVGFTFGKEFLIPLTEGMQNLSNYFIENKDTIKEWANFAKDGLESITKSFGRMAEGVELVYGAGVNLNKAFALMDGTAQLLSVSLATVFNVPAERALSYYRILRATVTAMQFLTSGGAGNPLPDLDNVSLDRGKIGASGGVAQSTRGVGLAGLALFKPKTGGGGYDSGAGGGGGGKTSGGAGLDAFATDRIKANFQKALRNLAPSLKADIETASKAYGIPFELAFAQIYSESSFNTQADSGQAGGLTQFTPATAKRFGYTIDQLKKDPKKALSAWGKYMTKLFDRYGDWELATLAYHQGEGTVDKFVALLDAGKSEAANKVLGPKGKSYLKQIKALSGLSGDKQYNYVDEILQITPEIIAAQEQTALRMRIYKDALTQINEAATRDRVVYGNGTETRQRLVGNTRPRIAGDVGKFNLEQLRGLSRDTAYIEQAKLVRAEEDEAQLLTAILETKIAIAASPYNDSLRIELGYLNNILDLRRREEDALVSIHKSQLELADSTVYHANQANASVLEFLASQRSVTNVIADAKINVIQSTYDLIDRGLDKVTSKLGTVGSILKDLISGFARLALNKFFQMIFGGGSSATPAGENKGGIFGNILNAITGGGNRSGNTYGTPPIFGNNFTSAGGLPISNVVPGSLAALAPLTTGVGGTKAYGAIGAGGGLKGLLGGLAPLLGLGLGTQIGAGSKTGSILGGAGGLLAGGTLAALLAPTALTGLGLSSGLVAGVAAAAPFLLPIAGAALIGSYFISRSKKRREQETRRNQALLDSFSQIEQLIKDVKADRVDGSSALASFQNIRSEYLKFASSLTDKKTRNHALADVHRIDARLPALQAEIDAQKSRQARMQAIVPTFASGGYVGTFNGRMPGVFDRKDDRLIRVSGNEVVLNPNQYAPIQPYLKAIRVPGFAGGGMTNHAPSIGMPKIDVDVNVNLEKGTVNTQVFATQDGVRTLIKEISKVMAQGRGQDPITRAVEVNAGRAHS